MLSAVNSARFANVNNYKRTYTNTNQNINQSAIGYQQSFGMGRRSLFITIFSALLSLSPANLAKAEEAGVKSSLYKKLSEVAAVLKARVEQAGTGKDKIHVDSTPYYDCTLTEYFRLVDPKTNKGKKQQRVGSTKICPSGENTASLRDDKGVLQVYCSKDGDNIVKCED